jgi:hypothetical protein
LHQPPFGAKGYGNLLEVASLQQHVAGALGLPVGRLLMVVKSAHVHGTELDYIKDVLSGVNRPTSGRLTPPRQGSYSSSDHRHPERLQLHRGHAGPDELVKDLR